MKQKTTCPQCKTLFEVAGERFSSVASCPSCAAKFNPMDELTKNAWEMTKTPEFQAALAADVVKANKSITHADFVAGVQNHTMGFKCMFGEPSQFIRGARRTIFNFMVVLYLIAPLLLIPFLAYHEHNWWLLIGIVVASVIAPQIAQIAKSFGGLLLLICAVLWFTLGFHHTLTLLTVCALWGFMFFQIAESCQNEYAMQRLIEHPEIFEDAIARNRIMIIRKDDESN